MPIRRLPKQRPPTSVSLWRLATVASTRRSPFFGKIWKIDRALDRSGEHLVGRQRQKLHHRFGGCDAFEQLARFLEAAAIESFDADLLADPLQLFANQLFHELPRDHPAVLERCAVMEP